MPGTCQGVAQISHMVRMNGHAYDAYTGAAGLPWADYRGRLAALAPIVEKVVESP